MFWFLKDLMACWWVLYKFYFKKITIFLSFKKALKHSFARLYSTCSCRKRNNRGFNWKGLKYSTGTQRSQVRID